jgi:hypothetical protein
VIAGAAEIKTALGLAADISLSEEGLLNHVHGTVERAIERFLGYEVEVRRHIGEYYPRAVRRGGRRQSGTWDRNVGGTRAILHLDGGSETLQVQHIPIRGIIDLREDTDGRHGRAAGAFPDGTRLVEGEDFWCDWEQDGFCPSGLIYRFGTWPVETGTVRVSYAAGYLRSELDGNRQGSGFQHDASDLRDAVVEQCLIAFKRLKLQGKQGRAGFVAGTLGGERMDKYGYSVGSSDAARLVTSFAKNLAPSVVERLAQFMHMGRLRV